MGHRNMYNDGQVDMAEQNSLVLYGNNTFDTGSMSTSGFNVLNDDHHHQNMYGSSLIQGESSNFYQPLLGISRHTESSNIPLYEVQEPFSSHYMEGMPLSAASFSTILASSTRGVVPRSANSSIDDSNSSTQTSLRWGCKDENGIGIVGSMIDPNGCWMSSSSSHQNPSFRSDCLGLPILNQELSLSLATANPTSIQSQYSEMGCSSSQYNGSLTSDHHQTPPSSSKNQSWRCNDKPFSSSTTYVHALQEILAALASYSIGNLDHQINNNNHGGLVDDSDDDGTDQRVPPEGHALTLEKKRKHLLALLQVVDKHYNQCLDEIHTTVSAFHAVTELNPQIHARFALQTISNMYRKLREKISNHIIKMGATSNGKEEEAVTVAAAAGTNTFEASYIQRQWALQQLKQRDHYLFRPQRGLPEKSVSVLKAWMFQNFLHPYPKDAEKHLLAVKSGLSRSQVSNWFINARVRIWKPMIEEMYAEMNRRNNRTRNQNRQQNEVLQQQEVVEQIDDNQASHVTVLENQRYSHY